MLYEIEVRVHTHDIIDKIVFAKIFDDYHILPGLVTTQEAKKHGRDKNITWHVSGNYAKIRYLTASSDRQLEVYTSSAAITRASRALKKRLGSSKLPSVERQTLRVLHDIRKRK